MLLIVLLSCVQDFTNLHKNKNLNIKPTNTVKRLIPAKENKKIETIEYKSELLFLIDELEQNGVIMLNYNKHKDIINDISVQMGIVNIIKN